MQRLSNKLPTGTVYEIKGKFWTYDNKELMQANFEE